MNQDSTPKHESIPLNYLIDHWFPIKNNIHLSQLRVDYHTFFEACATAAQSSANWDVKKYLDELSCNKILTFLRSGLDPNTAEVGDLKLTGLHYCSATGNTAGAHLLLNHGARVENPGPGVTPLMLALNSGHAAAVLVLIAAGADCFKRIVSFSPLQDEPVIFYAWRHVPCLHVALLASNDTEKVREFQHLRNHNGESILHLAARHARSVLRSQVDISSSERSVRAIIDDRSFGSDDDRGDGRNTVSYLIENLNFDVDQRLTFSEPKTIPNFTMKKLSKVVALTGSGVLHKNIRGTVIIPGQTALHLAVAGGHLDTVKALCRHWCNPYITDALGCTAMDYIFVESPTRTAREGVDVRRYYMYSSSFAMRHFLMQYVELYDRKMSLSPGADDKKRLTLVLDHHSLCLEDASNLARFLDTTRRGGPVLVIETCHATSIRDRYTLFLKLNKENFHEALQMVGYAVLPNVSLYLSSCRVALPPVLAAATQSILNIPLMSVITFSVERALTSFKNETLRHWLNFFTLTYDKYFSMISVGLTCASFGYVMFLQSTRNSRRLDSVGYYTGAVSFGAYITTRYCDIFFTPSIEGLIDHSFFFCSLATVWILLLSCMFYCFFRCALADPGALSYKHLFRLRSAVFTLSEFQEQAKRELGFRRDVMEMVAYRAFCKAFAPCFHRTVLLTRKYPIGQVTMLNLQRFCDSKRDIFVTERMIRKENQVVNYAETFLNQKKWLQFKKKYDFINAGLLPLPMRCKFCSKTQKGVLNFDHYCLWVGNAIGFNNHLSFILFTMFQFVCHCCVAYFLFSYFTITQYFHDVKQSHPIPSQHQSELVDFTFYLLSVCRSYFQCMHALSDDPKVVNATFLPYSSTSYLYLHSLLYWYNLGILFFVGSNVWGQLMCISRSTFMIETWLPEKRPWLLKTSQGKTLSFFDKGSSLRNLSAFFISSWRRPGKESDHMHFNLPYDNISRRVSTELSLTDQGRQQTPDARHTRAEICHYQRSRPLSFDFHLFSPARNLMIIFRFIYLALLINFFVILYRKFIRCVYGSSHTKAVYSSSLLAIENMKQHFWVRPAWQADYLVVQQIDHSKAWKIV